MITTEEMGEFYYDLYCALKNMNECDNTPDRKLDMECGCGHLMSTDELISKIKNKEKYKLGEDK